MTSLYLVTTPAGKRLVQAYSRDAAIRHVVKDTITARPITAVQMMALISAGLEIEKTTQTSTPNES